MNIGFILISMIFMHIIADFVLQGIMAELKQKKTYEPYGEFYGNDWMGALFMHSFMWSFMVMLPWAYVMEFNIGLSFMVILFVNTAVHAIIDHAKCNMFKINLITDQSLHVFQIIITNWMLMGVCIC